MKRKCNQCGGKIDPKSKCVYAKDYPTLCDKCRLERLLRNEKHLYWCPKCQTCVYPTVLRTDDNVYINCSQCQTGLVVVNLLRFFGKEA